MVEKLTEQIELLQKKEKEYERISQQKEDDLKGNFNVIFQLSKSKFNNQNLILKILAKGQIKLWIQKINSSLKLIV